MSSSLKKKYRSDLLTIISLLANKANNCLQVFEKKQPEVTKYSSFYTVSDAVPAVQRRQKF